MSPAACASGGRPEAKGAPARLALCGAGFDYGGRAILDGIDLDVGPGERMAVLGPNGAGKTTLLRLLAGALAPARGAVLLDGVPVRKLSGAERARRLAYVPQESRVVFEYSVLEVVLMGRAPRLGLFGIEGPEDLAQARLALERTDALHLSDRAISSLSSGERQRVLLARALAQEPRTLLLDEPTAFLDLAHQVLIHRILEDLNREQGLTIVFVTHDLNLAARHASRIVVLAGGRVLADGSPERVLTAETVRAGWEVEARIVPDPVSRTPAVFVVGPSARKPIPPGSMRSAPDLDPSQSAPPSLEVK